MSTNKTAEPRKVAPVTASIESVLLLMERQNEVLAKVAKVIHGKALIAEVTDIGAQIKALLS